MHSSLPQDVIRYIFSFIDVVDAFRLRYKDDILRQNFFLICDIFKISRQVAKAWYQAGRHLLRPLESFSTLSAPIPLSIPSSIAELCNNVPLVEYYPYYDLFSARWIVSCWSSLSFQVSIYNSDGHLLHTLHQSYSDTMYFFSIRPVHDGSVLQLNDVASQVFYLSHFRGTSSAEPTITCCNNTIDHIRFFSALFAIVPSHLMLDAPEVNQVPAPYMYNRILVLQGLRLWVEPGAYTMRHLHMLDRCCRLSVNGRYFHNSCMQHFVLETLPSSLPGNNPDSQLCYLDLDALTITAGRTLPSGAANRQLVSTVTTCGLHLLASPMAPHSTATTQTLIIEALSMKKAEMLVRHWSVELPAHEQLDGFMVCGNQILLHTTLANNCFRFYVCKGEATATSASMSPPHSITSQFSPSTLHRTNQQSSCITS